MTQSATVKLEERNAVGTRAVQKLRRDAFVPAVVYGHNTKSKTVQVPYVEILKVYTQAGKHSPVELTLEGKKKLAMIKRVDLDPVKHRIQHVAFFVVKQNEKVQTEVSVKIVGEGETPAERAGLVLIKNVDIVEIEAVPRNLPESLEVDGEKLAEAGDQLTVADITAPDGVTILSDEAQVIASAVEPAALQAANEAADEAAEEGDASEVEAENGGEGEEEGSEVTEDGASESKES